MSERGAYVNWKARDSPLSIVLPALSIAGEQERLNTAKDTLIAVGDHKTASILTKDKLRGAFDACDIQTLS